MKNKTELVVLSIIIIASTIFFISKNKPIPTPLIQKAIKDFVLKIDGPYKHHFSVFIPQGSTYSYHDYDILDISLPGGISVKICSECQNFIENCGGLMDGNPEEGGCAVSTIDIGNNITLNSHYHQNQPNKILGYSTNSYFMVNTDSPVKNGKINLPPIVIYTTDNRRLTAKDIQEIIPILLSIDPNPITREQWLKIYN